MTESEFNQLVDDRLLAIEEALDEAETDIDYENSGGVLTVTCENGQKVIFTRQAPVRQLWIAVPFGGFHFDYDAEADGEWVCDADAKPLARFLAETFDQLAGESFDFS
ncbi:iron donor protein CyaY [Motiliproteus coralliicola]|uniref:Iron-sulfur cluster assembly protein CyaY n=2 Tax=Motiliproteus coralliicola TaxID=2283196 RepID=A0A369WEP9_9GAMM|nr:iron donor protein CyaY [Motiliproteus coralliicola]